MTTKKKAKVVSISDEQKCRRAYRIPATHELKEPELIEWLVKIASDSKGKYDCSWIGAELMRRFTAARRQLLRQQKNYEELWNAHYKDLERLEGELQEVRRISAENLKQDAESIAELEKTIENVNTLNAKQRDTIASLEKQIDALNSEVGESEPCNSSVDTVED